MFNSYAKFYDLFNQKKPYKKEIDFIYKWAKKPKSIFDIGAGTGSYWKYYPKTTKLFGIERSPAMVMEAGNRAIVCADALYYEINHTFDCATALFDVINYISRHDWWKNIPVKKGGYFIFDVWDKKKVDKERFRETYKRIGGVFRSIIPLSYDGKIVDLLINFFEVGKKKMYQETHKMYLYSHDDILRFCGKEFEVVEVKQTKSWQTWYKLRRK